MSIQIVSHCWSGDAVPIYHLLLRAQLSSLVQQSADLPIVYTLFCAADDHRTQAVIDDAPRHPDITYQFEVLPKSQLFRRSIGRHRAAKSTPCDVVWFTDVDYVFAGAALQEASTACLSSQYDLVWPANVQAHRTHALGDAFLREIEQMPIANLVRIDPATFAPVSYRWAIGGVQIVKGSFCRDRGYAHRRISRREVDPVAGFQKCRGDADFRRGVNGSEQVPIDGVYRIRHSRAGRDGGTIDHSKGA